MAERDLTLAEVAELRRKTPRWLRDFVRRHKIPVFHTGKHFRQFHSRFGPANMTGSHGTAHERTAARYTPATRAFPILPGGRAAR